MPSPETADPQSLPAEGSRRTLYRDLVFGIILVVAVVLLVIGLMAYGYMSHKARLQSSTTLKEFSDYLNDSLELPIWNFDDEGIRKICNSFFENVLVERLKVTNRDGTVLFEKARRHRPSTMVQTSVIKHGDAVLGDLEIALNPDIYRDKQRQLMLIGIISLVAVVLVLAVTLRIVLRFFLIVPLDQLIMRTEQISRGEYEFVDLEAPQEEIRTIVARFNRMVAQIQHRERSLKAVNKRLEQEIIEHRDAESALLNSQHELDSIIRSTPDIIYRLDTTGHFTFVSDAVRRYGVTPEELIGRPFLDYVHEDDREAARSRINDRRTGSRSTRRLAIHAFGDYSRGPESAADEGTRNPVFLVDAGGLYVTGESDFKVFVGTQGIARDITEQRKMESARLESEDRLLLALEVSGAGIWQMDLKSGRIQMDERIYALLGYDEEDLADGIHFLQDNTAPETWEAIRRKFDRHVIGMAPMFDHEFRLRSRKAQWRWFHTKAKVIRFDKEGRPETMVGIILDTSERKESEAERERLETKLQQAQKMEAIGTLAGGIAHDFNNILGAIFGYAQLAQMHASDPQRIRSYVDNIFKASERAKGLVEQILIFTRQGKSQKIPSDIAIVLKEVVKLIRASIPTTIDIVQYIPTGLGTIMADQTQIHQVVMNLCTNAAHAMEAEGGRLEVTLEAVHKEAVTLPNGEDLTAGDYLQLSVSDTGTGMDAAVLDRIFDPYFTTKAVGEGTGMGLATVHGIVNDHGGRIFVESAPGQGSVFRVLFPLLEKPEKVAADQPAVSPGGSERILFVDDEEVLVKVGVEMLKDLGYDTVGTTSASRALEMFRQAPERFDLVITDMTMPDMTGDQLTAEILHYRADVPVIICTGYSKRMSSERALALGIRAFLMKPVSVQELARTIRDVLD